MQGKNRSIPCPVCKTGKLIKVTDGGDNSLHICTHPPPTHHRAGHFIKCSTCKSQIGISIKIRKHMTFA